MADKPSGYQRGGGGMANYRRSSRERYTDRHSGSSQQENSTFKGVCDRLLMTEHKRREFHEWLHSNHGIDGSTTELKFNELLNLAQEFLR